MKMKMKMNMNMTVFRQELKLNRTSFIGFTLGMALMFTIFFYFFNTFKESAAILDTLMKNFPPEFKAAFGLSAVNMAELNGYLTFLFSYVVLIGAVFGMKLGLSTLSEEDRAKTTDFLLTKPITRQRIALEKLAAILSLILVQCALMAILTYVEVATLNEPYSTKLLALLVISQFLIQLFFVGIGAILSVSLKRIKNVMPLTLGIVFIFFIIDMVNQSLMDAKLNYLTPFSYFKGSQLLADLTFKTSYTLVDLTVFLVLVAASIYIYKRKDMHAV